LKKWWNDDFRCLLIIWEIDDRRNEERRKRKIVCAWIWALPSYSRLPTYPVSTGSRHLTMELRCSSDFVLFMGWWRWMDWLELIRCLMIYDVIDGMIWIGLMWFLLIDRLAWFDDLIGFVLMDLMWWIVWWWLSWIDDWSDWFNLMVGFIAWIFYGYLIFFRFFFGIFDFFVFFEFFFCIFGIFDFFGFLFLMSIDLQFE